LELSGDPLDIYYIIFDQKTDRYFKMQDKRVMDALDKLDPGNMLEFTMSFVHHKESPYKRSEEYNRVYNDTDGL
jgi:hypothetical protein